MIGWKREDGERVQQPFYFGTDLDQAKGRYLRVKELWAHLERKRGEPPDPIDDPEFDPGHDRRALTTLAGAPALGPTRQGRQDGLPPDSRAATIWAVIFSRNSRWLAMNASGRRVVMPTRTKVSGRGVALAAWSGLAATPDSCGESSTSS